MNTDISLIAELELTDVELEVVVGGRGALISITNSFNDNGPWYIFSGNGSGNNGNGTGNGNGSIGVNGNFNGNGSGFNLPPMMPPGGPKKN